MVLSRRALIRQFGAGAAAAASAPSLADAFAQAEGGPTTSPAARNVSVPVRLNRNENAYGPSATVIAACEAALKAVNRYPDVEAEALRRKIAGLHRVSPAQVVLGCGSSEILRMAADAFLGPGKKLVIAVPTFNLLGTFARRVGGDVVEVPLGPDNLHDLDAMAAQTDSAAGLVYLCNPNNPTGTLIRRQALEALLQRLPATTRVLIDEAYHHYVSESADYVSFIDRPSDDPRVIVTRSFSTIYGLAGLRVGYAIAAEDVARDLTSNAVSDGVSVVAAAAASAALDDVEHVRASVQRNANDRQAFLNQANARMLRSIDSKANFVMVDTERPAIDVVEHFRKNNVLVAGPFPYYAKHIRVSVGAAAEMREFWRVCDLLPPLRMRM
jgi:histidinol-phosphate aminotransferase